MDNHQPPSWRRPPSAICSASQLRGGEGRGVYCPLPSALLLSAARCSATARGTARGDAGVLQVGSSLLPDVALGGVVVHDIILETRGAGEEGQKICQLWSNKDGLKIYCGTSGTWAGQIKSLSNGIFSVCVLWANENANIRKWRRRSAIADNEKSAHVFVWSPASRKNSAGP